MAEGILTLAERDQLIPEVAVFISGNPARLTTVIPQLHFIKIPTDPIPEQYAWSIIKYCEASAWMEDPALIIQLLSKWQFIPAFNDAITRIKACQPQLFHIPPRVWDPILVCDKVPLLNRATTRAAIKGFDLPLNAINPADIARVLVVTGPRGSGKTFTHLYVQYIKLFLMSIKFSVIYIDLKVQAVSRIGAADLTRLILDLVNPEWSRQGVEIPPETEEQSSTWTGQLCRIIADQMAFVNRRFVVVLDGLDEDGDKPILPFDMLNMIAGLASIATGETIPETSNDLLRLVLLGFGHPVKNFRNRVRVDKLDPLSAADIEKYFTDYATFYKKTLDPQGLQDMVKDVLEKDVPGDPERTKNLALEVFRVANSIINS